MSDWIEKLRVSKEKAEQDWFYKGRTCGERWVRSGPPYDRLLRVVAVRDDEDHPYEVDEESTYSAAELLFFAIDGQEYRDRGDARDFWQSYAEDAQDLLQYGEFLHGFVEGAADLFDSIAEEI